MTAVAAAFSLLCTGLVLGGLSRTPYETVVLLIGAAFFGTGSAYFGVRLLGPTPILRLTHEGLYDESTVTSVGFVPWEDVEAITRVEVRGTTMLEVRVTDFDELIGRLGPLRGLIVRSNVLVTGRADAFYVVLGSYGVPAEDVEAKIEQYAPISAHSPEPDERDDQSTEFTD